jgi:O-antigen/teichoic acid export membrane protein
VRVAASQFLSVAAANYAAIGLSFTINLLLTRSLGAERFGHLALLLTASHILAVFVANWSITALVRFGASEFAADRRVARAFWTRLVMITPWLVTAAVFTILAMHPLAEFLDVPGPLLALVFLHFIAVSLFYSAGAALQASGDMVGYGASLVAERVLALVLVIGLVVITNGDEFAGVGAFVASALLAGVGFFVLSLRHDLVPFMLDRASLRAMWRFSLPLMASTWAGLLSSQWTDYLFIRRYLTVADLGHYSLAYQLAGVVQQITIVASTLLLPRLSVLVSEGNIAVAAQVIRRLVPYWLLCVVMVLGASIMLGPFFVPLVFGADFAASVPPFALLIVATIALAVVNMFTPLFAATGATWTITRMVLASGLVNIVCNFALIPVLGVAGAALATLVAYATSLVLTLRDPQVRTLVQASPFLVFAIPVSLVYAAYLLFDGAIFVAVSLATLLLGSFLIVRVFNLFRNDDLALLRSIRGIERS